MTKSLKPLILRACAGKEIIESITLISRIQDVCLQNMCDPMKLHAFLLTESHPCALLQVRTMTCHMFGPIDYKPSDEKPPWVLDLGTICLPPLLHIASSLQASATNRAWPCHSCTSPVTPLACVCKSWFHLQHWWRKNQREKSLQWPWHQLSHHSSMAWAK